MAKFSDRLGVTKPPNEIQVSSVSNDLRISLWNLISRAIGETSARYAVKELYIGFFKQPFDELPNDGQRCMRLVKETFMTSEWYEVYNLIEHILQNSDVLLYAKVKNPEFEKQLNAIFERELSGYRAINGEIVPITDKSEVEAIRQAADTTSSLGLEGPSQHILNALHLIGKKPAADYRNSIKESISAVESICKLLTGKSGELKGPLSELSSKINLHPALRSGFLNLYGYTSDEDGIRHAILESKDIGFAEAKFMLVTCSAFVNFLIDKARQAGML